MAHHPNYRNIYLTLLVLLVISVVGPIVAEGMARSIAIWITLITAFGIAVVKANLVINNFMHLKWERRIIKWVLATTLALMVLFFFGIAPDVMKHEGTRWENYAAKEVIEHGLEEAEAAADEAH
jgi:caa(3)-type oxidase subunit IV